MSHHTDSPLGFWRTVRLLLGAARKRSAGRRRRQQELLQSRSKGTATDWSALSFILSIGLMAFINGAAAFVAHNAVEAAQREEVERGGKIIVSVEFYQQLAAVDSWRPFSRRAPDLDEALGAEFSSEAGELAQLHGISKVDAKVRLRDAYRHDGIQAFVIRTQIPSAVNALSGYRSMPAMFGSLVLIWWGVMLVFQGEGLELDTQRRRSPMWEWLFSHPVPAGAVFLAEMLSPIAANPIFWTVPLFPGFLYGLTYGPTEGFLAALLIGPPLAIAAACIGKALEISAVLRLAPRTRGAVVGFMSWLGYASMLCFLLGLYLVPVAVHSTAKFLAFLSFLPWPWLGFFLGVLPNGSSSFPLGVLTCWAASAIAATAAIGFSVWSAKRGLSGNFGAVDSKPRRMRQKSFGFGKDPLYRKEILWFIRDRGAIVQTILIPLTVAGFQVFNLRGILVHAQGAWNYLCGVGIVFGTYFLWVLGPKSLASEGTALWIALTWPRGLESLLKAKAWLWSMISSALVALILCYAAFSYPTQIWKIALVGIGWFFFGRSMAEKSVTLVTITSESGEQKQASKGRRWATMLGMLTFSIGILTQQWHVAIMGIVYSYITAAAIWQNFRATLPFLFDPWSERIPPPPTLMHAMISISILVEGGAVVGGIFAAIFGQANLGVALAISYGVCSFAVSIGVSSFLENREVYPNQVWYWGETPVSDEDARPWWRGYGPIDQSILPWMALAMGGGLALALFARGYSLALDYIPFVHEMLRKAQEAYSSNPQLRIGYAIAAICFAPFAEEYLFRGLLFRALDREWGGWRAVLGSAAFFAVYHPVTSWPPVFLLGVANALLFKKSHRLMPAVLLHMVYNIAVVL